MSVIRGVGVGEDVNPCLRLATAGEGRRDGRQVSQRIWNSQRSVELCALPTVAMRRLVHSSAHSAVKKVRALARQTDTVNSAFKFGPQK